MLQFMGLQRIGHDLATEQQNSEIYRVTSKVVTTHSPRFKERKYIFYQFFLIYFLIEGKLLYNVVLVSAI